MYLVYLKKKTVGGCQKTNKSTFTWTKIKMFKLLNKSIDFVGKYYVHGSLNLQFVLTKLWV